MYRNLCVLLLGCEWNCWVEVIWTGEYLNLSCELILCIASYIYNSRSLAAHVVSPQNRMHLNGDGIDSVAE